MNNIWATISIYLNLLIHHHHRLIHHHGLLKLLQRDVFGDFKLLSFKYSHGLIEK